MEDNFICEGESAGAQWVKWNILIASNTGVIPFCAWHDI
jgi:hypothetical protein